MEAIKFYLRKHYTDEKLAALLAHAQDGKLAYASCCCLAGIPTADHALQGHNWMSIDAYDNHETKAIRTLSGAYAAASAFGQLGTNDTERRKNIIPLILEEMQRRDALCVESTGANVLNVSTSLTTQF